MSTMNSNVESLKQNFNKNISNLSKAGKSRRESWTSKRRFRSI